RPRAALVRRRLRRVQRPRVGSQRSTRGESRACDARNAELRGAGSAVRRGVVGRAGGICSRLPRGELLGGVGSQARPYATLPVLEDIRLVRSCNAFGLRCYARGV